MNLQEMFRGLERGEKLQLTAGILFLISAGLMLYTGLKKGFDGTVYYSLLMTFGFVLLIIQRFKYGD